MVSTAASSPASDVMSLAPSHMLVLYRTDVRQATGGHGSARGAGPRCQTVPVEADVVLAGFACGSRLSGEPDRIPHLDEAGEAVVLP